MKISIELSLSRLRNLQITKQKKYLNNLLYNVPLSKTMKYIIPFYVESPVKILDVTAGEGWIWEDFQEINQVGLDGKIAWDVTFNDISQECKLAQYNYDARELHKYFKKNEFNVLVFDPPFQKVENEMYAFGVKVGKNWRGDKNHKRRDFYFRGFIPVEQLFRESVEAFNHICSKWLIVKMGNRHENHMLINQDMEARLAYDFRYNPLSEFVSYDIIYFRPYRAMHGAKLEYAQQVVSFYIIFKKNQSTN